MADFTIQDVQNGLTTFPYTIPASGYYFIKGKIQDLTYTTTNNVYQSAIVVTVSLNAASAFYTGPSGARGFETSTSCNAGDVIKISLTSAATSDQLLNLVKTTININN